MSLRTLSSFSFVLSLALVGCSGDDGSTASSGETSTSDSSTSSASATSSSTSGVSSTSGGSESMTGDTSTSGTSTTGPSETTGTTAEPTTGTTEPTSGTTAEPTTGSSGEPTTTGVVDENGCMPACELLSMCFPYPLDECMADCQGDFDADPAPECQAAKAEANACLGGLACDAIMGDNECVPLFDNVDMVCDGGMMMCTPSQMAMGKGCSVNFDCGMANFRMQCNQNNCACLEDGQQVGACANMDFCALDLDAAVAAANDCCGWNF